MSDGINDGLVSSEKPSNTKLHVAAGAAFTFIGATLALTAPFVVLTTPLPYMATPAHKIARALQSLPSSAKRGTFVDLGSGDGTTLYMAHVVAGFHRAIGYEVNWTLWGISQFRRNVLWGRQARWNTQIYCADFFKSSLPSDTTTVMVFGVRPLMTPLSIKLAKETRPGVFVLSYRFPIPIQDTDDESTRDLLRAKLVYNYEEMRIYEVDGAASE